MSLLDEIEERARVVGDRQAEAEAARRAGAELAAERARPRLAQAERFLQRASKALNGAGNPVTVSYQVPDLGRLTGLRQGNYQVARDPEQEDSLRFHFECTGDRVLKGVLPSESRAVAREKALVEAGLSCRRVAHGTQRRALLVQARVPVSVAIRRAGAALSLRTRNLAAIEIRSYTLPPERVDAQLLEALLEVVLRRGDRLAQLTGDTVPEPERARLRLELARRQRQRRAELGGVLGRALFPITEALRRMVLRQ